MNDRYRFFFILTLLLFFAFLKPAEGRGHETNQSNDPGLIAQAESAESTSSQDATQPQETESRRVKQGTETILIEKGGLLLPRGTLVIEPNLNYSHFSRNQISISGFTLFESIVIGTIQVEEIKRDIVTGTLTFRYGLLDNLQLELKAPYLYRRDRLVSPAGAGTASEEDRVRKISDIGLGDIETNMSWHAFKGRGWQPDIILNIKWKSRTGRDPYELDMEPVEGGGQQATELPTGTGHYGLAGGVTLVKGSDPVVFFGGLTYFKNYDRNVGGSIGRVSPGDSIELNLGMALALSEKASLNFSFQDIFTMETKQNGVELPESELNAASFFVGTSYKLSRRVSLFGTVGVGLTEDSPDFQVQINFPITF